MTYFKLTAETKIIGSLTLYRIECIKDFIHAKKGDKGGFIEKESNLSGNAWVFGNARVFGDAEVSGNARVSGDAEVSGDARVYGNANVSGYAWVYGNANVSGYAWVSGNAWVYGNANVSGDAEVSGDAVSTRKVFTLNFKYNLTLTDNHIRYGCEQKTVKEWEKWLDSSEEFDTSRTNPEFKIIEMSLRLAIKQHKS